MKTKTRIVKKVKESGLFALRHHEVEECINDDITLECKHGDEIMTMTPETLKNKQLGRSPWINDESGEFYVIDYRWVPNTTGDDLRN